MVAKKTNETIEQKKEAMGIKKYFTSDVKNG